jgi:hypothetical protein
MDGDRFTWKRAAFRRTLDMNHLNRHAVHDFVSALSFSKLG